MVTGLSISRIYYGLGVRSVPELHLDRISCPSTRQVTGFSVSWISSLGDRPDIKLVRYLALVLGPGTGYSVSWISWFGTRSVPELHFDGISHLGTTPGTGFSVLWISWLGTRPVIPDFLVLGQLADILFVGYLILVQRQEPDFRFSGYLGLVPGQFPESRLAGDPALVIDWISIMVGYLAFVLGQLPDTQLAGYGLGTRSFTDLHFGRTYGLGTRQVTGFSVSWISSLSDKPDIKLFRYLALILGQLPDFRLAG